MGKNILTIGDIHGSDSWQLACKNPEQWDNIVFVGDYCDSFKYSDQEIFDNLERIVAFKKSFPQKVVLLLGNHDVHYIDSSKRCSGFRVSMFVRLSEFFRDELEHFQMAFQYGNHLWTHAGLTEPWFERLMDVLQDPNYRFSFVVKAENPKTLADWLNLAWTLNVDCLHDCDPTSGGTQNWSGPLWCRPNRLDAFALEGVSQIVGHTFHKTIQVTEKGKDKIYYVDCINDTFDERLFLKLKLF